MCFHVPAHKNTEHPAGQVPGYAFSPNRAKYQHIPTDVYFFRQCLAGCNVEKAVPPAKYVYTQDRVPPGCIDAVDCIVAGSAKRLQPREGSAFPTLSTYWRD